MNRRLLTGFVALVLTLTTIGFVVGRGGDPNDDSIDAKPDTTDVER